MRLVERELRLRDNDAHLCVETPRPNLVQGMRWLQATFALRFNRLRGERGHLFQGRYKALLVAPETVGAVCHYIHLNPVRAGLVGAAALPNLPWTSLAQLTNPRQRPAWLSFAAALDHAGGLSDTPAGRRGYVAYLGWLQEDEAGKKELEFERLSKGWAVGSRQFKKELLKEHADLAGRRERGDATSGEIAEELWAERLGNLPVGGEKDGARCAGRGEGGGLEGRGRSGDEAHDDRIESLAGPAPAHGQPLSPEPARHKMPQRSVGVSALRGVDCKVQSLIPCLSVFT